MKRVPPRGRAKPFLALWLGTARLVPSRCTWLMAQKMQLVKLYISLGEQLASFSVAGATSVGEVQGGWQNVRRPVHYVCVSSTIWVVMRAKKLWGGQRAASTGADLR
uniref:Secreted protein n=1 Tax=Globodera rostochiensis TaxID=31243 RepID=A0A914GRT9_GLORO